MHRMLELVAEVSGSIIWDVYEYNMKGFFASICKLQYFFDLFVSVQFVPMEIFD